MSSKTLLQERQFSKFSESREKLDVQYMENAADETSQNKEYDSQSDYRNSLAWDSAFFTSPGILDPEELFATVNFRPSNPSEQERTSSICHDNSRRSLAWDSAFFTSAGVLDPEELSMVNKGFKESGRHLLPESEEQFWRSVESNSAMTNDGFSLASLEIDLFDDLKAYFHNSSKTSKDVTSSSKMGRGNRLRNRHSLKNSDASSRVKMKSMPASKRQILNTNGSERIAKPTSLPPQAQHVARGGNCNPLSSLKPPKVLGRFNSPSTSLSKRAPLGPKHSRMEDKAATAASGQHINEAKRPCLADSSVVMANSTAFSKSPSSASALSDFSGRSPLSPSLAVSDSPSPMKVNSSLPSQLLSSFKSFCISPASSIDIIRSSDSLASIGQISDSTTENLDTTPSTEISFDCNASQASDSKTQRYLRHENVNKNSNGSSFVLKNVSENIKPSGLRMPSPKIGFFDAENSMELTPNGDLRFRPGAHGNSSKTGRVTGNNNGAANRSILSKIEPTETSASNGNKKLGSERNRVLCPSGIRSSYPVLLKEDKGAQGCQESIRAKRQKDARTHRHKKILQILDDDDKENLCSKLP